MAKPFGTEFAARMAICRFGDGAWSPVEIVPTEPLSLHPAAHVLHYGSTCFEGLKAYRSADGGAHLFRLDRHAARMRRSAQLLCLPVPDDGLLEEAIVGLVRTCRADIPDFPGALYLRPTLIGTLANIGSATKPSLEACLYVLASPVGSYFERGEQPLRVLIDDHMRSTSDFGMAKTGGNYASALRHLKDAKERFQADQVLFCPGGDVQETGAANFLLINDRQILTKKLDGSILHGVTRESLLRLGADMGFETAERDLTVEELLQWIPDGEAALSGTAAVLTAVGTMIHDGKEHRVGDGQVGPNTQKLRAALNGIQNGTADDPYGWRTPV